MILKSDEIERRLDPASDDPLFITPRPTKEALGCGSAAVDLRLGTWFATLRHARMSALEIGSFHEARATRTHYVRFGDSYYLQPSSFAHGVTLEWLKLPRTVAGYVVGKSSLGRRGLIIATATGVHPGFTGCLTLELTNAGEMPIKIEPGMRICQLFLHGVQGDKNLSDKSTFSCRRRPILGLVARDKMADRLRQANSQASSGTLVGAFLGNLTRGMRNEFQSLPDDQIGLITKFVVASSISETDGDECGLMVGNFVSGEIFRLSSTGLTFSLPGVYAGLHTLLSGLDSMAPIALGLGILAVLKEPHGLVGRLGLDASTVVWATYLRSKGEYVNLAFHDAVNAERSARGLPTMSEEQMKIPVDELIRLGILSFKEGSGPVLKEWLHARPD